MTTLCDECSADMAAPMCDDCYVAGKPTTGNTAPEAGPPIHRFGPDGHCHVDGVRCDASTPTSQDGDPR